MSKGKLSTKDMKNLNDNLKTTIHTYDKIASDYSKRQQQLRDWDIETQRNLVQFAGYLPLNAKVLDLGCGPGHDTHKFNELGFQALGIDLSKGMLIEAKIRHPCSKFILSDMRWLSLQDANFDGVWMSASLLHIPRIEARRVLFEIKRVLRNGGYLYISLKYGQGEITTYNMGERVFVLYSNDEIRCLIRSLGFDILEERCFEAEVKWITMICNLTQSNSVENNIIG
jgi:ubiquinone/menaquinone biosynthesis C-methylase UbiE